MSIKNSLPIQDALKKIIQGDVASDDATRTKYSHDASLLEVRPEVVVFPRHAKDVSALVAYVAEHKKIDSHISLTARSGGTCMAGGSINESIIMDFSKYMNRLISLDEEKAVVQPGMWYRDFEKETLAIGKIMPAYTASKDICAVGGMFGNNCGGEKTLKYGKAEQWVKRSKTIFADGIEYDVKPLTREELELKRQEATFEGRIYNELFNLLDQNYDAIKKARPNVSKNSAGYYLWNVWDRETEIFDLNKLLVGSQGTLGITTEIEWGLIPVQKAEKMLVIFMEDIERVGELVRDILPTKPDSIESYDDASLTLAIRFFPDFIKSMGLLRAAMLGIRFIPEALMMLRGGVPKLVIIVEFTGETDEEIIPKVQALKNTLEKKYPFLMRIPKTDGGEEKYWKIRHESFNLLRKHVDGKRTAPFIDDVIVPPETLPKFLPRMRAILDEYKLLYTVAGHAGNGNFHIIPLMDMSDPANIKAIDEVSELVYSLIQEFGGSITAEHNDGIVRTPYLYKIFSPEILTLFQQVKDIFDPQNIFNPGKKVGGTKEYMINHIRIES